MFTLFILFTWPWWVLLGIVSGFMIFTTERANWFLTTTLLAALICFTMVSNYNPIVDYAKTNPWVIPSCVVGYFVAGAFYGIFRMWRKASARLDRFNDLKTDWLTDKHNIHSGDVPENLKAEFGMFLLQDDEFSRRSSDYNKRVIDVHLHARDHKALIAGWMTYWPWSLSWYILNDLVKGIFNKIQRATTKIIDKITHI